MEELYARIVERTGVSPEIAEKAVAMILSFIVKEAPAGSVEKLMAAMPGTEDLLAKAQAEEKSGILGSLFGMMGGGIMGLAARLTSLGLGMDAMQAIGREVLEFAREQAGPEEIEKVAAAIPALRQLM